MSEYKHKEEIVNSRRGCLGGSDAKMLMQIAENGSVPQSAHKRLAVCKGLIEPQSFTNLAMEFGNYIEDCVFKNLHEADERWQSNPCLVSERFSRKNVKCIDHVDFFLQDDEKKTIIIGECKATQLSFEQTRHEYEAQLLHHTLLGNELAAKNNYKLKVLLCHYSTAGLDLNEEWSFDISRLTVKQVRLGRHSYQLDRAMDIVNTFLDTFNEYYVSEEIDYAYLPSNVQKQFDLITATLAEIKERERTVNEFKARLYDFLREKGIKSIKSESFNVVLVNPTEAVSVDYKTLFIDEIESKKPRVAKRLKEKYKKVTKRNGYVTLKIK